MTAPTCAHCGEPIPRQAEESPARWRQRKYCCIDHQRQGAGALRRAARVNIQHPPCAVCGAPVVRRASEAYHYWLGRSTCSPACGYRRSRQQRAGGASRIVRCATCGIPLSDPRTRVCASEADNRWCWMRSEAV